MAYIINKTNGANLVVLDDGTVNVDACDLTLIGRNVTTYGERQNENFIRLLENFANSSAPSYPLEGQLWYDSTNAQLKIRIGSIWQGINTLTKSATTPTGLADGDVWYNTTTGQVYALQGSTYRLVGPLASKSQGDTRLQAESIADTPGGIFHEVLSVYIEGVRVAVVSGGATFNSAEPGFSTIRPGINLSTAVSSVVFSGTSTNSSLLNNLSSSQFMRTDIDTSTSGNLSVGTTAGQLNVGDTTQATIMVDSVLGHGFTGNNFTVVRNSVNNEGISLRALKNSVYKDFLIVDSAADAVYINGSLVVTGGITANAALALSTARNIALSGVVTGNVNFDGSQNVTITTALAADRVRIAGDTMTGQLNANAGFVAGTSLTPNLIVTTNTGVGILTASPAVALDVNGAIRSIPQVNASTSGAITVNGLYNNHQINLAGAATITLSNFNQDGQIVRIIFTSTLNSVSWPGTVYWPNNIAPTLSSGPQKIAVVTLVKPSGLSAYLATYVSY